MGKNQELHKAGIVTTKIQQCLVACHSDGPRQKHRGRAAAAQPALGNKQVQRQCKSRMKRQVSGSRPRRESISMQASAREASDVRHLLFFFSMQASHCKESVVRKPFLLLQHAGISS